MEIPVSLELINGRKEKLDAFNHLLYHGETDFKDVAGREHYRLLNYFSSCVATLEDSTIFDIGTHQGRSALALANPGVKVISVDIKNKLTPEFIDAGRQLGISFHLVDLIYDEVKREEYEQLLLASPLIFIDVDPHNGKMELILYNYFKEKNYQGLLLFDDIHYFSEMREFWSKIPEEYKVDLTKYGHWSGTGAVTFNSAWKIKEI